jgi:hypothetical protein
MPDKVMSEIQQHQGSSEGAAKEAAQDAAKAQTQEAKKAHLDLLSETLKHIEAQTLSGTPDLTPKDLLLDLSELKAKHPDRAFRWVNIKAPGIADRRRLDGYIRLPEVDGGRELGGEVAIFVTTKRIHEHREAEIKKLNKQRLQAHRAEVENAVEAVARELRDKYGLKVSADRILVDEE